MVNVWVGCAYVCYLQCTIIIQAAGGGACLGVVGGQWQHAKAYGYYLAAAIGAPYAQGINPAAVCIKHRVGAVVAA